MNNQPITEPYVSYPTAVLLKGEGFDVWCPHKLTDFNGIYELEDSNKCSEIFPYYPTIALVVEWLRVKYNIWIRVTPIPYSDNLTHWRWEHMSTNYSTRNASWKKEQDYMSPQEAYEAAITYCLNHLM